MLPYLAEFLGTALILLLGNSAMCNGLLSKSAHNGAGPLQIGCGWAFSIMMAFYMFAGASGGHFNCAITIAMAVDGALPWNLVPGYLVAQFFGAFVGALGAYLLFKDHIDAEEIAPLQRATFCTSPSMPNPVRNFCSEVAGGFILLFGIKGLGAFTPELIPFAIFFLILGIGASFGGNTGCATNSVRDLAPRLLYHILPIKNKCDADWKYAPIPVFGPIVGGVLAVVSYNMIPWAM